jgi:hypothetical protein
MCENTQDVIPGVPIRNPAVEDLLEINLVDVAPAPMFSRFHRLHDRMPLLVEVGRGMAVLGGIATTNLAALQAHAQVDPSTSDLETLLATLGVRVHLLHMIFYVGTLRCAHGILLLRRLHHRQFDEAGMVRRVIDALRGFLIIRRLGPENIRHEGLRVSVV